VEKIKTHSRQYAKRQLTWLRKDREVSWFEPEQLDEMIAFVRLNS
jgi:tRNA dimethylallyltransferase